MPADLLEVVEDLNNMVWRCRMEQNKEEGRCEVKLIIKRRNGG